MRRVIGSGYISAHLGVEDTTRCVQVLRSGNARAEIKLRLCSNRIHESSQSGTFLDLRRKERLRCIVDQYVGGSRNGAGHHRPSASDVAGSPKALPATCGFSLKLPPVSTASREIKKCPRTIERFGRFASAAAITLATKASRVIVRVKPNTFLGILDRQEVPLVVHATGGFFNTT